MKTALKLKDRISVLGFVLLCALAVWVVQWSHAQLPVGTIRQTVETDASGNILNTNLCSTNQIRIVNAPTLSNHIARYMDVTGATDSLGVATIAVLTNGSMPMGAPLNFGGYRGTNLANAVADQDAVAYLQLQGYATTGQVAGAAFTASNNVFTATQTVSGVNLHLTNAGTALARIKMWGPADPAVTICNYIDFFQTNSGTFMGAFGTYGNYGLVISGHSNDLNSGSIIIRERSIQMFAYDGISIQPPAALTLGKAGYALNLYGIVAATNEVDFTGPIKVKSNSGYSGNVTNQSGAGTSNVVWYSGGIVTNVSFIP